MNIDDQLISRLEKLARLKLDSVQREALSHDLTKMLEMVEKLSELDLSNVEPLIHPVLSNPTAREDKVQSQLSEAEALKNAPDLDFPFFQVPKVIQK